MTDLIPNDLSHLSDKDFNALCPQGHHAPGAEPLSPAAQAVLDAMYEVNMDFGEENASLAAAALRAAVAATQSRQYEGCWICSASDILAIAAELEGQ